MPFAPHIQTVLRSLHWRRGLRAGFAVAAAMLICRLLGRPMGWAALGGFEATLVDNGGPYRSRMQTIAAVLIGGALCGLIGSLLPASDGWLPLIAGVLVTAIVCFAVTFARVIAQPIANTAVIILVIYVAGFGSTEHTLAAALTNIGFYIFGGLLAAAISLFLWPVDPFRPARLEVAACYDLLAGFTAELHAGHTPHNSTHDDDHTHAVDFKRQLRTRLESARAALGATAARAPSRTVRARNLSVLLETADMLFAETVRLTELAEITPEGADADPRGPAALTGIARWLAGAEQAIARALRERPADNASSFTQDGSHYVEFVARREALLNTHAQTWSDTQAETASTLPHLLTDERDALQNIEIAFEALRALWTGIEAHPGQGLIRKEDEPAKQSAWATWLAAARENWTTHSTMMRHALRMATVGAIDVLLIRKLNLAHGFWLAMTSIIVLQPYSSGTLRKSMERVGGTIAGGLFAAGLVAVIHTPAGIIVVITLCSVLTLATYAVDYGWYSFFLTPTFVLMSLPHLRDWRYAGVRMVTTLLGALTAVLAMQLFWPQSLTVELSRLLARSANAAAEYLRATLRYWEAAGANTTADHVTAEREILAPARRACGLTSQDAEEALDRVLLDTVGGSISLGTRTAAATESALTFTTYVRRFTQCLTTLAAVGSPTTKTVQRVGALISRLDALATSLNEPANLIPKTGSLEPIASTHFDPASPLAEQMLQRMERQTGVLERSAAAIAAR